MSVSRKDGTTISRGEMQLLFQEISKILVQMEKRPDDVPNEVKMNKLMDEVRSLNLQHTPENVRLVASHFMVRYHEFKANSVYQSFITRPDEGETFIDKFEQFKSCEVSRIFPYYSNHLT